MMHFVEEQIVHFDYDLIKDINGRKKSMELQNQNLGRDICIFKYLFLCVGGLTIVGMSHVDTIDKNEL